jgi:GABA(A) receptor-associated protein
MPAVKTFREETSLEQRITQGRHLEQKYPNRIPVIVEPGTSKTNQLPALDKRKFLVPADLTISQLVYIIRRRVRLGESDAIFIYVNNTLPPASALVSAVRKEHGEAQSGFLFITYQGEETFG